MLLDALKIRRKVMINKSLLFLVTFVFCFDFVSAQDWTVTYTPRYRQLKDVHVIDSDKIVIVGGHPFNDSITYMATTENTGTDWTFHDIYPGKQLQSLLFFNNQNGICAGLNESFYRTNDWGLNWEEQNIDYDLNNRDIRALHKGFYGDIFAAGGLENSNGYLIKSQDQGESWSEVAEWIDNEILDVFSITNIKYAVCGYNKFINVSSDSGNSWFIPNVETVPVEIDYLSLDFFDINYGLCVGGVKGVDSVAYIMKTSDGGENWSVVLNQTNPCLNDICIVDDELAYAVGDYGIILKSEDAGENWTVVEVDENPEVDLYAVDFINAHIGAISGQWGYVFLFDDGLAQLPEVNTMPALNITNNSAYINASFNPSFVNTELSFCYGIDESLSNEIILGNYSGGENLTKSYFLENLLENQQYYYQARISNLGETKSFFTGNPIPNWDFELWTSVELDFPDNWYTTGNIEKQDNGGDICIGLLPSESNDGHDDISVVMNAKIEGGEMEQDWHIPAEFVFGGQEISARPETLSVEMNYDIEENDTSVVFLGLFDGENYVAENVFFITGSSSGEFVNMEFEINYLNSSTPDRLAIAITNSNPFDNENNWNSNVSISSIWFDDSELTLLNNDFNEWTTISYDLPESWLYKTKNGFGSSVDFELPFYKTSDSYFNENAIVLQNLITDSDSLEGRISLKDYDQGIVINNRFETFSGYYKFFPENQDTARINVIMYKSGEQIGWGYFEQADIIDVWSKFDVEINYSDDTAIPDSMNVILEASQWPITGESRLYLDKLSFDGDYIPVEEEFASNFRLYPNPTNDIINISNLNDYNSECQIKIIDLLGKIHYNCKYDAKSNILIDVANLDRGVYIVLLEYKKSTVSKRFIKI